MRRAAFIALVICSGALSLYLILVDLSLARAVVIRRESCYVHVGSDIVLQWTGPRPRIVGPASDPANPMPKRWLPNLHDREAWVAPHEKSAEFSIPLLGGGYRCALLRESDGHHVVDSVLYDLHTSSLPVQILATIPLVAFCLQLVARVRRERRQRAGQCVACGYDLRAATGRCPECGAPAEAVTAPVA